MYEDGLSKAQEALYLSMASAVILPPAWEIVATMYLCQCDPNAYSDGAETWKDAAKTLRETGKDLEQVLKDISHHDWDGDDRKAFESKMKDFRAQVGVSEATAEIIHSVLLVVALVLYILVLIMWAISLILAAMVVYVGIVAAATLGTGTLAAIGEMSTMIQADIVPFLETVTTNVDELMNAVAAILGGTLTMDIGGQMLSGNAGAVLELVQAQVPVLDVAWRGALQRGERNVTGKYIKYDEKTGKMPWPFAIKGGSDAYGKSPTYNITGRFTSDPNESPGVG